MKPAETFHLFAQVPRVWRRIVRRRSIAGLRWVATFGVVIARCGGRSCVLRNTYWKRGQLMTARSRSKGYQKNNLGLRVLTSILRSTMTSAWLGCTSGTSLAQIRSMGLSRDSLLRNVAPVWRCRASRTSRRDNTPIASTPSPHSFALFTTAIVRRILVNIA
jgi:hypothetical protein